MDKKINQQLIISTKSLLEQAKKETDLLAKITLIDNIFDNLVILKEVLEQEEYSRNFQKLEDSINKIITGLTSPDFVKKVVRVVEDFSQN